jgi:hypothetical protein
MSRRRRSLALAAVVRDVGADRGFLLSEIGFQSGALRVAHNANITLTNVADLREAAHESLIQSTGAHIHWRMTRVKRELLRACTAGDIQYWVHEIAFDRRSRTRYTENFRQSTQCPKRTNASLLRAGCVCREGDRAIDRVEDLADEAKLKSTNRA